VEIPDLGASRYNVPTVKIFPKIMESESNQASWSYNQYSGELRQQKNMSNNTMRIHGDI
jgi:hypothetical protein